MRLTDTAANTVHRAGKFLKRAWADYSFVVPLDISLEAPVVSFTFDDAPASAFDNAGRILSHYGYQGTFYIALSLMSESPAPGGFSPRHLPEALEQGHELACHTFGHLDLSHTPASAGDADMARNLRDLQSIVPAAELRNFSYPFGAKSRAVKELISRRFRSARGIGHGLNAGRADRYNLRAVRLYEDQHALEEIYEAIGQATGQKAWLIFYTHDVAEGFSRYGCSPSYFEAVAGACARAGVKVLTVDDALNLIEQTSTI